ncbi:MAG: ferritin family protein [Methanosarcinaceae archaeon]|nr:ferritin family protein [Methanosarcinaceae archaeon]
MGILEEIADEVKKLKTLDDMLKIAISIEEQNRDFYQEKVSKIKNVSVTKLYSYLAREEGKHAEYLRNYQKNKIVLDIDSKTPDFKPVFDAEFTNERLHEIGVYLAALRLERKTEYFYMQLSKRTDNTALREFFDKLASIERGHYELIDGFLEYATQFRMQT